jgi:anti-anti-sigma factor
VPHIDSVGVGWLVRCHKHFQDAGGTLVLFAPRESVRQVFELLNLTTLLNIADQESSARALAQGTKPAP